MLPVFLAEVAVELAEQGIAVFLGPVGQVSDEILDLLARGLARVFTPQKSVAYDLTKVASSWCWRISWQRRSRTLGPP